MRTKIAVLTGAVVVLSISLIAFGLLPASSQQGGSDTFKACDQNRPGYNVDVDADDSGDFSAGDYSVFQDRLLDPATGDRIGTVIGRFTAIRELGHRDGIFMVDPMFIVPKGKLSVFAVAKFSSFEDGATFPVTGGTNNYANATGTVTARDGSCAGKRGIRFVFDVNL